MTDNPLLRDLTPHLTQRGRFRPEPGARIAIMLPGEQVSAIVVKVVTPDTLVVQLGPVFFQKHHQYRKDDIVPVRRGFDKMLGVERWEIVGQARRDLASAEALLDHEVGRVAKAMTQFGQAEAALSDPVDSAAPMPQALPNPAAAPLPAAVASPDQAETMIVAGPDGTLRRSTKPRKVPRRVEGAEKKPAQRPSAPSRPGVLSTGSDHHGKSLGAVVGQVDPDFWQ